MNLKQTEKSLLTSIMGREDSDEPFLEYGVDIDDNGFLNEALQDLKGKKSKTPITKQKVVKELSVIYPMDFKIKGETGYWSQGKLIKE